MDGNFNMSDLNFEINVEEIAESFGELKEKVKKDLIAGVQSLATMTHAKTLEIAGTKLKSLKEKYMENVEFDSPEEGLWVVTLKKPAMFIEEGRKSGFMSELLTGKSSKISKEGKRYAVIPFEHSKKPSQQSAKANELANQIKTAMKEKGIPWKKLEVDESGSPRIGRLHSFSIDNPRMRPEHKGSLTKGISVYQTKDPSTGKVRRDVMTFRVITDDHKQEGLWNHPGMKAAKIMDEAFEWAMDTFSREILPEIFKEYS